MRGRIRGRGRKNRFIGLSVFGQDSGKEEKTVYYSLFFFIRTSVFQLTRPGV